ncbi:hypothetical protein F5Y08DRAFT_343926 [Xylaria arbuscula]|nr:hypothetical protein F5Y08DRAFT_343926 [Xylaria arbuscula]
MSIAPPAFLPVLLGHGSFVTEDGGTRLDSNGDPLFVLPPSDNFLVMKPSKEAQQFWPQGPSHNIPKGTAIVLFSIILNTHCHQPNLVTEIGYTIYDTAAIFLGAKAARKSNIPGCVAPGPRGENITRLALSSHFIVDDEANHHPQTCNFPNHTAQPYNFTYRKSSVIPRTQIKRTLEEAWRKASHQNLTDAEYKLGQRRAVVLVGWGEQNHHPEIKSTSWYMNNLAFQQWDIRLHPLVRERMQNPTFLTCLDVFGIQHKARGNEVGHNAGNHSAFTIQLLIGLCFLTQEQLSQLRQGKNLEPNDRFPGVESVLARDNRPPGSAPLVAGQRVPILH